MFKKIVVLMLIFFLSGCSPVRVDPPNTYALSMPSQTIIKKSARAPNILVTTTDTSFIYNTTQMAYRTYPYQIAYFAKNVWADTPSRMIQNLIIQTLQKSRHFHAVNSSPAPGNYDYLLSTQLVELRQDFISSCYSVVRLTLRAQLINANNNHIIATKQFAITQPAPQNTPYGGVIAANRATAILLDQVLQFTLRKT